MPDQFAHGGGNLVGRERELRVIAEVLASFAAGRGGALCIEGGAGTGKTSLLSCIASRAEQAGCEVLATAAIDLDEEVPLAVATRLLAVPLRTLARGGSGSPAALEGGIAAVHALVAVVGELAAARRPLVVCVDDLHQADQQSLELFAALAALCADLPVVLALAWRRGDLHGAYAARLGAIDDVRPIELTDLDASAADKLVARHLPAADPEFLAACRRVTGGNPFLVRELVAAIERDGIAPDAEAARRINGIAPRTVTHGVLTRLGRLNDAAAHVARAVAILGDQAPVRHVALVAGVDLDTAAETADTLVAAEILAGETELAFRHPLLAAAVLEDLGPFTRARWYRRAADVVATEGLIDRAGAHLLRADAAGDPVAVELLHTAAARAYAHGDSRAAQRLLIRALAEPPPADQQADLLIALARAETALGETVAVEHLDAALAVIEESATRAEALRDLARMRYMRLDMAGAASLAERAVDELGQDDPGRERVHATWVIAAGMNPDTHAASVAVTNAYSPAARDGDLPQDPELQALVAINLACTYGDPDLVERLAVMSVEEDAATSTDGLPLGTELALAALLYCRRLGAAERSAGRALELADERGSIMAAAAAAAARGLARLWQGDVAGAEQDAERALAPAQYGWDACLPQGALIKAQLALARDDVEAANAAIALAADLAVPHPPFRFTEGHVELASGHAERALALFIQAGEWQRTIWQVESPVVVSSESEAGLAALRLGDDDCARALAAAGLELAQRTGIDAVHAHALRVSGLVTGGEDGLRMLQRAAEMLANTDHVLERLQTQLDLGAALRRAGRRREARDALAPARAEAEERGLRAIARRAADEQHTSGARLRRVPVRGVASLTPSELRIARLAASGATNRAIAAELFLTAKTVEWHLGHVFRKLDITSRRALPEALGSSLATER